MAGFMAAMINLPYIQIPTTLLAQADSSIGGKTAVDTEFGKNLVGAFKQPRRVYLDIATLATLPEREYISGLAETIKHGFIQDADFFNYLLENISRIKSRDQEILLEIAMNNCRIKGNVVEQDPEERGLRSILNFGHTIGHAIEKLSVDRYEKCLSTDYLSHGEAIAIGGMAAARISRLSGFLAADDLEQLEFLLTEVGLKTRIPAWMENGKIIDITLRDKKARDGKARYALPIAKGRMHDFGGKYTTFVENELVIQALNMTR
jgi:3-dehydroquinate synthase